MPGQLRLNLPGLHAKAADFELLVESPQKFNRPLVAPADPVSRPVEAGARTFGRKRMRQEGLGSLPRTLQVPSRQACAAGIELARNSTRDSTHVPVQDECLAVGDGLADRKDRPHIRRVPFAVAAGEGRILRRAVAVDEAAARKPLQRQADVPCRHNVASRDQLGHAAQALNPLFRQQAEKPCRQPERAHSEIPHRLRDLRTRRGPGRYQGQPRSVEQRPPDFEDRRIEAGRRQVEEDLIGTESRIVGAAYQADHGAMTDQHPLGTAAAARGVCRIGQLGGIAAQARIGAHARGRLQAFPQSDRPIRLERMAPNQAPLDDPPPYSTLRQHALQTRTRTPSIKSQVSAARLEHSQHGRDQLWRSIDPQSHEVLGLNAPSQQIEGDCIGLPIQFAIGDAALPADQRQGLGTAPNLRLEELVDAGAVGKGTGISTRIGRNGRSTCRFGIEF